jgi:DnaA family protein
LEQLIFELAPPEPQRLANFLPGKNGELVAALERFVEGRDGAPGFLIWGAAGAGKTHLLRAAVALVAERGVAARYDETPASVPDDAGERLSLLAVDRVDEADAGAVGRIFTAYNALKQRGGRILAASRTPLATMALREDLRTRLGWGLVYEAVPLSDAEKAAALAKYARERGFELSADVIDYLLRHGRRDMGSLLAAVAALDRLSLASKRPITVPLLRDWLQAKLDVGSGGS